MPMSVGYRLPLTSITCRIRSSLNIILVAIILQAAKRTITVWCGFRRNRRDQGTDEWGTSGRGYPLKTNQPESEGKLPRPSPATSLRERLSVCFALLSENEPKAPRRKRPLRAISSWSQRVHHLLSQTLSIYFCRRFWGVRKDFFFVVVIYITVSVDGFWGTMGSINSNELVD